MTSVIASVGTGLQRRPNKDKRSQPNKSGSVANHSSANESNQNNHISDKIKADSKLQPTAEQIRIANLMNDKMDDNDLKAKIDQIIELTGSSRDDAVVALHDCDNDTAKAIDMILELEGDSLDSQWRSTGKKKKPPKSASNANTDENLKPDSNRDSNRGDQNRDGKHLSSKPNSRLQSRGGGPPRLQRAALANRGGQRKPREQNKTNVSEKSDNTEDAVFKPLDPMAPPSRRGDRRGRGRGGSSRGNRGAFSGGAGRGTSQRIFQNRGIQSNDGFPNSIDTWTNSTADQNNSKATLSTDCNTMTVGNWSDIATNEDWSEEDWEPNHMETKVFTPSTKISEKEEMEVRDHPSNQTSGLSQFMSKPTVDANQSMSSLLSSNVSRNPNVAAGQTLLHQIQQSNAAQNPALNQYSLSYNKQATESIKSLVGLNSGANFSANNADLLSNSDRDLDSLSSSQPSGLSNKTSRIKQTRPSKIPESAVEMPSNDTIAALGVHFGTLEFGSDQFSLGTDFSDTVSHVNKAKKADANSLPQSSMLSQSSESTYRPSTTSSIKDSNKGVSPIISNPVLGGHQSMASDSLLDRSNKSSVGQFAHKVLERNNKSDYSSVPSQQNVNSADITSNYKNTYSSDTSYNYSTTTPSSYSYSNSQSVYGNPVVGNYSTNFSGTNIGNTSNSSNQKLRDMDSGSQQKQYDVSNNSVGSLGLNSTVTTNVLKNTLSATGKGVHNVPPGVATPVLSTPYIVQNPGVPIYPMGIPYDLQFQTTARDHNFGPYTQQDVKYGRGSDNEVIPASTSQTGVSQTHNQTFVNTFPPGYGFYLAPGINMMPQSIYPTAGPLYPVPQPQNTGSAGSAFPKANTTYGSHSYNSGYDSISAQTQDYVKQSYPQSVQQHNKGITGSNTSDLTSGNTSIYSKNHSQIKSYDKQGFQTQTPAFNLSAGNQSAGNISSSYGGAYVLPHSQQAMSLHTMSSLQTDVSQNSGSGVSGQRSLSQSHKNSNTGANSYNKYSWS
ncbi:unnamed protein product [Medioppia subpectinata]|uniref:Uncharacterized protein n=1 Tax=Medioppia subpectinata TaxID=1979941 RepID=A0A7R9KFG5_9ACAR|nr:unnamed protein product [Medioppia subpectinata]CAG2101213.1 unnamed protein product [Medioppia subpectinata]